MLTLFDWFESSRIAEMPRSPEVSGVTLRNIVWVALDPLGAAVGGVGNHPFEERCSYPVSPVRRGNEEA